MFTREMRKKDKICLSSRKMMIFLLGEILFSLALVVGRELVSVMLS
jgi:hypothetical protein